MNHYSRELESVSTALNTTLSTLCTPPRTKISEEMRMLQCALGHEPKYSQPWLGDPGS